MFKYRSSSIWILYLIIFSQIIYTSALSQAVHSLPRHLKETAYPFIKSYGPDDYAAFDQNFAVCQDSMGIMYFANGDGALTFDGSNWELIPLSNNGTTYSIACASDQTIYVGGSEEVGYLKPDSSGMLQYVSMLPKIPLANQNLGTVRQIISTDKGLFFYAGRDLYLFKDGQINSWHFENAIGKLFLLDNQLHIAIKDEGLAIIKDREVSYRRGFEGFQGYITVMLPMGNGSYIIGANTGALYTYDNQNLVRWPTEADSYLNEQQLRDGILLDDSTFALATQFGGILVIDNLGSQRLILNNKLALPSRKVFDLFQDSHQVLWAGMDFGISKIEYPSRFSIINEATELDGVVSGITRHDNNLYIYGEYGIVKYIAGTLNQGPRVQSIYETKDFIDDMLSFDQVLLFTTQEGVHAFVDGEATRLNDINANSLQRSVVDRHRVFVGHQGGLQSLYYNGDRFIDEQPIDGVVGNIYGIVELSSGELWLETEFNTIYQVSFNNLSEAKQLKNPKVRSFSDEEGLPNIVGRVFKLHDQIYFREIYGDHMYYLDRSNSTFRLDSTIMTQLGEDQEIKVTLVDQEGNVWFEKYGTPDTEATMVAWHLPNGSYQIQNLLENRIFDLAGKRHFYESTDNVIWHVGKKSITRHDLNIAPRHTETFYTRIRRITINDSLQYSPKYISNNQSEFDFSQNDISFDFSAPLFNQGRSIFYQYYLVGHESSWSDWTKETTKSYTNLLENEYTFRVRAKNMFGKISDEDIVHFSISPPWHRSWLAYILYVLAGILGTAAIVRWRSNQLEKEKLALQQVVLARTSELQVRNEQLLTQKEKLALQTEQLKEVDQLKSRLFANISHEFRTPLTLIKGPLDQIERFPDSKLSPAHYQMMQRNTDRLLRLVNQLLDLSKLDAGNLPINLAEGNIHHCIRMAASAFSSKAAERNLDYQIHIPAHTLWTTFDRDKIEKVVYNLLSNAFKFTPSSGTIMIKSAYEKNKFVLEVSDTGTGIKSDHLDRIFDRFYQIDNSDTKRQEGSGIGLALVKELVELMGGQITIDSTLGIGSHFYVELPLDVIKTPASRKELLIQEIDKKMSLAAITKIAAGPASTLPKQPATVLIVEDNPDMRQYVSEQLENMYATRTASTGQEGLKIALKIVPDLIVTDLMMPEMDGLELCKLIKSDQRTSHIPVIMLTAKAGLENKLVGLETGADSYLTKPFDARELQIRTKNLIDQRARLRDVFSKIDQLSPQEINWPSLDQEFLQKVLDLLEKEYSNSDFGVPQMQKALAMSKTQLHRKMKALTNIAPGEFLRNFRLKRAVQILDTGENVTQTAYAVGFHNLSYFAKCFRELHGMSPKEYGKDPK